MVRNHPEDPFQRRNIVDRTSSSYAIKAQLIGVVHGHISSRAEMRATLLVLSFRFLPRRRNVRIKSVSIRVEIHGDAGCPTISAITPDGQIDANIIDERMVNANAGVGITGTMGLDIGGNMLAQRTSNVVLTGYRSALENALNWTINEDPILKTGVPPYLQTAILLLRSSDGIFKANVNVKADVSGYSFRNLQDGLLESEDDPVIFDPGAYPVTPNDLAGLDSHHLGSVDLSQLCKVQNVIDDDEIPLRETFGQIVRDLFQNDKANDDASIPVARRDQEIEHVQQHPGPTDFCNLIARQSSESQLTTFDKLESLLNEPPVALLSDFFELPDDFEISRRHDRGGYQVYDGTDGSKTFKLYIIQTPFYSTGFWSILLYSMVDSNVAGASSKLSGVIQADAGVDLRRIFGDVRDLVARHGHHRTLLPVQLFRSHYESTLSAFNSIQTDVGMVDEELLRQLEEESKLDDASKLYRKLSMTLHKCSMNLAELDRRRKFEEELGARLQEDLKNDSKLKVVVEIYSRMSQSPD
ncbi:hypothetical protein BFJ72_g10073 [Fusarium proliferatum]|uniref:Uncharacterized protein n=1 Tax=Gibberella intermedia TaxID=948311 RepID=A0A420SWB8_GIBIN|nr:hypothetical protein BFJ72_g10073 [Fusarium proliferatum]